MPSASDTSRLFEDVGALKALMASVDRKLDDGNEEFKNLRREQDALRVQMAELKTNGDTRTRTISEISDDVKDLSRRVDQLMALRYRLGGAFVVLTGISGALYEAWDIIVKLITYLSTLPK